MISKQRVRFALEQFLQTAPNAVFDVAALADYLVQALFHLELVGFGGNHVTSDLAMQASEVLSGALHEDDELVFMRQNTSTIIAEIWDGGKDRRLWANNAYDTFQVADAMVSLARKRVAGG